MLGIPAKFHKTEPFRCLFSSVCSDRGIRKQSWRSPQCRESCQEQGLEKPASDPVNPGCTCLCPDPELALPEEAEGVNGTGLESGEAQDQAPR